MTSKDTNFVIEIVRHNPNQACQLNKKRTPSNKEQHRTLPIPSTLPKIKETTKVTITEYYGKTTKTQ